MITAHPLNVSGLAPAAQSAAGETNRVPAGPDTPTQEGDLMNQRRDYGPTGCCQPLALATLGAFAVLGWAFVFLAVQVARWVI